MRPFHVASILGLSAMFAAVPLTSLPAGAQTMDTVGPHSGYCGSWQSGTWTPNGRCTDESTTTTVTTSSAMAPANRGRQPGRVTGTITFVKGHLVTLQQATDSIVINDQPALNEQATGRVAVGRSVVAHGYWDGGTFFAKTVDGHQ